VREQTAGHLKLHVEPGPAHKSATAGPRAIDELCFAFQQATGWQLQYHARQQTPAQAAWSQPVATEQFNSESALSLIAPGADDAAAVALTQAKPLATAISHVIAELEATQQALWEREAELAAGVPITSRPNEKAHLAKRLESVLEGGAKALDCCAAALYLLDDATTELKLRSAWGLPKDKLLEPARPLKGSIADLEALVGHAVVLEDTALLPHWRVPESFASAVCVPVSTSTVPLGTLWFFGTDVRDYNARETNLAEIVAGRIAADLEREMLLQEGVQSKQVKKQWAGAVAWQQQRLPQITPLLDGWQVAGWTEQIAGVGGDFYDWSIHPDGRLCLALGDAHGAMLTAGLTAASLQAAVRSHGNYPHDARGMLQRLSETLWTTSTGDQLASLFYALIDLETGSLECSSAGSAAAMLIRTGKHEMLFQEHAPLGADPDENYAILRRTLIPNDVLLLMSEGIREARDHGGLRMGEAAIAQLVRRTMGSSAQELSERIRDLMRTQCPAKHGSDRTIVVLKRR
jgi:serine phosphatase RsbU (regulator of sigma subunit)